MIDLKKIKRYNPSKEWFEIQSIDTHTGGEPLRIIISGYPELKGKTILEKRKNAKDDFDNFRKVLMWEPRGHADMYGAIIVEPDSVDSHFGVIFTHNDGYSTGCGHAVIALTKVFVETGLIPMTEPETEVRMDVPSGFIRSFAKVKNGKVDSVRFQNVPSFVQKLNAEINVTKLGKIKYDLAFGGAFYAVVDVAQVGLECSKKNYYGLIEAGMKIKSAIMEEVEMNHPIEPEMNYLYGTIFTGPPKDPRHHSRNVCIFAEGEVDRCPTGTGVSARAAIHYARNEIIEEESLIIESILDSNFHVKVLKTTTLGNYESVIPEVSGNAFIIGKNTFWINPEDPLKDGFILS